MNTERYLVWYISEWVFNSQHPLNNINMEIICIEETSLLSMHQSSFKLLAEPDSLQKGFDVYIKREKIMFTL